MKKRIQPSPYARPGVQICMAGSSPLAVVVAWYSGRRSRMLLWETDRDVFHLGHWLKGAIELLDVSPDGRYAAYYAETFHRPVQAYMSVSRPPFLTALFFQPVSPVMQRCAFFSDDGELEWSAFPWQLSDEAVEYPRLVEGCPMRMRPTPYEHAQGFPSRQRERPVIRAAVERYGPIAREVLEDPGKIASLFPQAAEIVLRMRKEKRGMSATWDNRGRLIVTAGGRVLAFDAPGAEGLELLDLSKTVWSNVATPEWAREW